MAVACPLADYGARWYSPSAGQFQNRDRVTVDPVGNSAAASPFAYAGDDPLGATDPTGHLATYGSAGGCEALPETVHLPARLFGSIHLLVSSQQYLRGDLVELRWVSRGTVFAEIGDRTLRVVGELLLEHNPDFMIYSRYIDHWEDGTPLTGHEKLEMLDEVVAEAARRGWKFEIE